MKATSGCRKSSLLHDGDKCPQLYLESILGTLVLVAGCFIDKRLEADLGTEGSGFIQRFCARPRDLGDWTHLGLNAVWLLAFGTPIARRFHEMGFEIMATSGTASYLRARGIPATRR